MYKRHINEPGDSGAWQSEAENMVKGQSTIKTRFIGNEQATGSQATVMKYCQGNTERGLSLVRRRYQERTQYGTEDNKAEFHK